MSRGFPSIVRLLGAFALAVVAGGCASTGAIPRPFPIPADAAEARPPQDPADKRSPASPEPPADVRSLLRTALALQGRPYLNGGSTPEGFDCSGYTQYVFGQHGLRLPREVRDQFKVGSPVRAGDTRPGDLVFFTTTAPGASHVGIALGDGTFVHAPSSKGVVRVERMSLPYWSRRFVGIRRLRSAN
jgi:cell wall-associated NlpC family hydrolase